MSQQTEPAPGGTGGGGPWNPPPPRSHKRLYRRTDDKMIGGVASGLADYFDIDPVLVRIGFVILALLGGAGVLAYLVMWWVVPPTHEVSNAGEDAIRRLKRAPSWVAVALLVIGGVILASQLGPSHGDIIWGIGLIALGGLLFWHTSDRGRREMAPHPAGPVPPAPFAPGPAIAEAQATEPDAGTFSASATATASSAPTVPFAPVARPQTAQPSGAGLPPQPAWQEWERPRPYERPRPPKPPKEHSGLGLATFGAALLAVGVTALLDNWGLFDMSLAQYLALGLTVLAIGLLIGAWVGRAKWLILPAVLLVPFVFMASLVDVPFKGGWGDRTVVASVVDGSSVTYHQIAGRMVLDLRQLPTQEVGTLHVTATEVAGSLEVLVPIDTPVHVEAEVGAGALDILGVYDDGLSVHRGAGQSAETAELDLDLSVSFGRIVVSRAEA